MRYFYFQKYMTRIFIALLLTLLGNISNGQTVSFGDDAKAVHATIKYQIASYERASGDHNVGVELKDRYSDGVLQEVIVIIENQYQYDFKATLSYTKRYIMEKGKLNHIITHYKNISTTALREYFNKGYFKIGDRYLSANFRDIHKIYLAGGLATVESRSADVEKLSDAEIRAIEKIKKTSNEVKAAEDGIQVGNEAITNSGSKKIGLTETKIKGSNRTWVSKPTIKQTPEQIGVVVLSAVVTPEGTFKDIKAGVKGTTIPSFQLWQECQNSLIISRVNPSAAQEATYITFYFNYLAD